MSICVISQRNHDYTEQICRLKKKKLCEQKTFAHRPMRICVAVYFLKKSQPNPYYELGQQLRKKFLPTSCGLPADFLRTSQILLALPR